MRGFFKELWDRVVTYVRIRIAIHELKVAHVDVKTKCPACGNAVEHKISYAPAFMCVLHQCGVCTAMWADQCIIEPAKWAVKMPQDLEQELLMEEFAKIQEAADNMKGIRRVASTKPVTKVNENE